MEPMSEHPEEFNEFLFTPKDRPDGSKPTDEDEKRRLESLSEFTQRAAKEEGLTLIPKGSRPPDPVGKTRRSAEVTQQATVLMPAEDEKIRNTIEFAKQSPEGEKKLVRIRLGILDDLGEAVKSIAKTPGQAVDITKVIVAGGVRFGIHVGKLLKVKVGVEGENSADEDSNL
jgi:hypothetical protein